MWAAGNSSYLAQHLNIHFVETSGSPEVRLASDLFRDFATLRDAAEKLVELR